MKLSLQFWVLHRTVQAVLHEARYQKHTQRSETEAMSKGIVVAEHMQEVTN